MQGDLLDSSERWERLVTLSVARLREFEPEAPEGYILCDSGGKDSEALRALAIEAGVRYEAHYHATTIDPPEVVRHIRRNHPETIMDRPEKSMVELIRKNGLPSRWRRWCCRSLKEHSYPGRVVLTGVRWAESPRRAKRKMVEPARQGHGQSYLHPLIDWTDADVWGYLRARGIPACSLYAEGQRRIGCVLCPLCPAPQSAVRWPHIAAAMRKAWLAFCAERNQAFEANLAAGPEWTELESVQDPDDPDSTLTRRIRNYPAKIADPEATWERWITTGRATQEPEVEDGCPLFADAREP
jgi:phosphoadenosine phosphosulfate reductase